MWSWILIATFVFSLLANTRFGASQTRELRLQHGKRMIAAVRFTADGKRFVSASFDGTLVMWDTQSGRRVWARDLDEGPKIGGSYTISNIQGMDVPPDGSTIAA